MMHYSAPIPSQIPSAYSALFPLRAGGETDPSRKSRDAASSLFASGPGPAPKSGRAPIDGHRILVVEDEMFVALDLEMSIEELGGRPVGPIQTVEDGLSFLQDGGELDTLSAAILDINLHGEDVFPIARALRAHGVPFVFYTGHGDRTELNKTWAGVPVCPKPITPERLLGVVGDLLAK